MFLLPSPAAVLSAEPPVLGVDQDLRQERMARQTLYQDKVLGPLNLGVRVHHRVAVLWGPVPSADLARRAVELLRQLPTLVEVRDDLNIQPPEEPPRGDRYLPAPQALPMKPAIPNNASPRPSPHPAVLTKNAAASLVGSPSPVGYPKPQMGSSVKPGPQAPDYDGPEGMLPAIAIPSAADAVFVGTATGDLLIERATRHQRSDPRFRHLRVEVQGKVVHLQGQAQSWADIHELARRIANLAGVERVVLGDLRTLSSSR
jgi:osmotically-inducible protein OsmY